jgi:hypothetical protein
VHERVRYKLQAKLKVPRPEVHKPPKLLSTPLKKLSDIIHLLVTHLGNG